MSACIDKPVSWLRLEQLRLGELSSGEAQTVRAHLEACGACSECLQTIERDHRVLSPLDLASNQPVVSFDRLRARLRAWMAIGGVGLVAAAALLLVLARDSGTPSTPDSPSSRRVSIKGGGDLVLTVMRERGGNVAVDPPDFAAGDRFKVALTCDEVGEVPVDAVVIQDGALYRPLGEALSIRCGNNVTVPGAFTADGDAAIQICVSPHVNRSEPLRIDSLEGAACATLTSQPASK